jgi:predicted RNase H-like nuclease (RuvC/YqgF family)
MFDFLLLGTIAVLAVWNILLLRRLGKARANYKALEQGMDEQDENYGQDFLNMTEKIQGLENGNRFNQGVIAEQEEEIQQLKERLAEMERRSLPPFPYRRSDPDG